MQARQFIHSNVLDKLLYLIFFIYVVYLFFRSVLFFYIIAPSVYREIDFNHYYSTSYLVLRKINPYGVDFKNLPIRDFFHYNNDIAQATNPPLLALILAPLALLQPWSSWLILSLLNVVSLVLISILVFKIFFKSISFRDSILCILLFFSSSAVFSIFVFSQVQAFILFFCLLGFYFYLHERKLMTAFLWGFAFAIKFMTWPLLAYLLLSKSNRYYGICSILFAAVFMLLPCWLIAPDIYRGFIEEGAHIIAFWSDKSSDNLSVINSLSIIFSIYTGLSQIVFIKYLSMFFYFILFWMLFYLSRKKTLEQEKIAFSILLTLSFTLGPISWSHYFIVLIVPIVLVYSLIEKSKIRNIIFAFLALSLTKGNKVNLTSETKIEDFPSLLNFTSITPGYYNYHTLTTKLIGASYYMLVVLALLCVMFSLISKKKHSI